MASPAFFTRLMITCSIKEGFPVIGGISSLSSFLSFTDLGKTFLRIGIKALTNAERLRGESGLLKPWPEKLRIWLTNSWALWLASRMMSISFWAFSSEIRAFRSCARPMTMVRRLLKSWAIPPANKDKLSKRLICSNCLAKSLARRSASFLAVKSSTIQILP